MICDGIRTCSGSPGNGVGSPVQPNGEAIVARVRVRDAYEAHREEREGEEERRHHADRGDGAEAQEARELRGREGEEARDGLRGAPLRGGVRGESLAFDVQRSAILSARAAAARAVRA